MENQTALLRVLALWPLGTHSTAFIELLLSLVSDSQPLPSRCLETQTCERHMIQVLSLCY